MIEIRIHGRGGMGVKKAANILARAAYLAGYKTQDFALYGAERRGAPLTSFVRFDKNPIQTRGYIFEPDYIIVLDSTLPEEEYLKGKTEKTTVIINTPAPEKAKKTKAKQKHTHTIDATEIALKHLGKNIPNTPMLGAFIKLQTLIKIEHLKKALEIEFKKFPADIIQKNMQCAEQACREVE